MPHVACFDTAFHRGLPEEARRLPLPDDVAALGVQRYGFHGLSAEHVVATVADLGRAVVAHLGSGCSVTALAAGRPVHTSMSFTPAGGVVSGTRSGDLDPAIVVFLTDRGWSLSALRDLLDHRSGLAGLAGGRHDVRDLLAARASGDADAELALAVFTRSVAMEVAACTAVLGGLDTLVFTGGVGERAAPVRTAVADRLAHLGVQVGPRPAGPGADQSPRRRGPGAGGAGGRGPDDGPAGAPAARPRLTGRA